jgi:hypothetical protein
MVHCTIAYGGSLSLTTSESNHGQAIEADASLMHSSECLLRVKSGNGRWRKHMSAECHKRTFTAARLSLTNPGAQCSLPILFLRRLKFHRLDGHHLDGGSRLRRHENYRRNSMVSRKR